MEESRSRNYCFDTHFPLCLYTVCTIIIWLLLKSTILLRPALCLHLTYEDFPTALKIPDVVSVLQLTCLEIFHKINQIGLISPMPSQLRLLGLPFYSAFKSCFCMNRTRSNFFLKKKKSPANTANSPTQLWPLWLNSDQHW